MFKVNHTDLKKCQMRLFDVEKSFDIEVSVIYCTFDFQPRPAIIFY